MIPREYLLTTSLFVFFTHFIISKTIIAFAKQFCKTLPSNKSILGLLIVKDAYLRSHLFRRAINNLVADDPGWLQSTRRSNVQNVSDPTISIKYFEKI